MRTRTCTLFIGLALFANATPLYADDDAPTAPFGTPAPTDTEMLKATVDKSKVDLKAHRLEMVLSRDAVKVTIQVFGESGTLLADREIDFTGTPAGKPLVITWTPKTDETATKIELKAWDTRGFWAGVDVTSWSVFIPHQDVNFKSGSAKIDDSEKPKLEESFAKIADVVSKHGDLGPITLFVAGHTDTVGKAKDNFKLSEQRARAIAAWFQARGLTLTIAYEGFGEASLLVKTADEVGEVKNRRVDYILSLDAPAISAVSFTPVWKKLK